MVQVLVLCSIAVFTKSNSKTSHRTGTFFFKINFSCGGSLLLCTVFSSCREWGLFSVAVCGLLIGVASLVAVFPVAQMAKNLSAMQETWV